MVRIKHFMASFMQQNVNISLWWFPKKHIWGEEHSRKTLYNIGFYTLYLYCFPFQSQFCPALVSGRNCAR